MSVASSPTEPLRTHSVAPLSGPPLPTPAGIYDASFWFTYVANTMLMCAVSLLFRYSDFVLFLHGTEFQLGLIVGTGMIGSLLMRLAQGSGVDRYGPGRIWVLSLALLVASLLGHLWITRVDGPTIYLLQIFLRTSIAGAFGASITSIFQRVPPNRMAEAVGTLGTSGFLGTIVGPQVGDLLFAAREFDETAIHRMFYTAAALASVSLICAFAASRRDPPPRRGRRPPSLVWVLKRYNPGAILLMSVAMGFGLGFPGVFLRTYTAELAIPKIGLFFSVYAACAFSTRILTRRLTDRFGSRPMILIGMSSLILAIILYLFVSSALHLVLPAIFTGIAHALLFPAIIAGGSAAFPSRYRGVGTALMLAMFDAGTLIGAPLVGTTLLVATELGLAAYSTAFFAVASLLTVSTVYYAFASAAQRNIKLNASSAPRPTLESP